MGAGVEAGQRHRLVRIGHSGDDDQIEIGWLEHRAIVGGAARLWPDLAGFGQPLVVEIADGGDYGDFCSQCLQCPEVNVGLGSTADHPDAHGAI